MNNNESPHVTRRMVALNPRQARFVSEYIRTGNGTAAALAAGYSPKNARSQAADLVNHYPAVMAAIAEAKKVIGETTLYDAQRAMAELDEAIAFAVKTNNATAYARCLDLKMRIVGLGVEKKEAPVAAFQINIEGLG